MQCFLSNLNPDILTQQVNLFLESCFHSLLPFGSSQHYSEPLQGDALFPRASPLQKQSTGLFLNSPLAEGLLLKVFRALRSATRGSAPWTPQPLKRLAKLFDSGLSRIQVYIPESVKLMSPLRAAKGGFAVPLSFIELYFISISALVSQKVETPFLNPRGKPDFND